MRLPVTRLDRPSHSHCLSSDGLNCPSPPIRWNKMPVHQNLVRPLSFPRPLNLAPSAQANCPSWNRPGLWGKTFFTHNTSWLPSFLLQSFS